MSSNAAKTKQARVKAGLSVQQMADLMGVTRMTVYSWENGTHPIKPRDLEYMQIKLSQFDKLRNSQV